MKHFNTFATFALAAVVAAIPQDSVNTDPFAAVLQNKPLEPPEDDSSLTKRDGTSEVDSPPHLNYAGDHRFDAREITGHPHAIIVVDNDDLLPNNDINIRRDGAKTPGIFACCNPNWKGQCNWTPLQPGMCQTFNCAQGPDFGSSFGPDQGVKCDLFVGNGCQGPKISNYHWGMPESLDTGSQFWVKHGFENGIVSYMCWPA